MRRPTGALEPAALRVTLGDCHIGRQNSDPNHLRRAGEHNHGESDMKVDSLKDGTIIMVDDSGTAHGWREAVLPEKQIAPYELSDASWFTQSICVVITTVRIGRSY
jgi:hypothetical protein